jgi:hypothetical protein
MKKYDHAMEELFHLWEMDESEWRLRFLFMGGIDSFPHASCLLLLVASCSA